MTFADIYNEVVNLRFNGSATKLAQVKKWVNQAEIALWNAEQWEFRRPPMATLSVTAGAASEPADFGKGIAVIDPRGDELEYLSPEEFERNYIAPVPVPSGNAEAWTVIDRQILVGPPETSTTFKLSYRRRYTKRNSGGTATQGVMSADLDTPYWDSEHHYLLVPWAMRLGEVLEADPTAQTLDQVIDDLKQGWLFRAMKAELVGGVERQVQFWGARSSW